MDLVWEALGEGINLIARADAELIAARWRQGGLRPGLRSRPAPDEQEQDDTWHA